MTPAIHRSRTFGAAGLVAADLRLADVALPDRSPGHFEHPFERDARRCSAVQRVFERIDVADRRLRGGADVGRDPAITVGVEVDRAFVRTRNWARLGPC